MNAGDVVLSDDELDALSEAGAVIICTSDCCNHYGENYSPGTPCSTLRVLADIIAAHITADRVARPGVAS